LNNKQNNFTEKTALDTNIFIFEESAPGHNKKILALPRTCTRILRPNASTNKFEKVYRAYDNQLISPKEFTAKIQF
jgi:hypothetical protein